MQVNYRPVSEQRTGIPLGENIYKADPSKLRMRNYPKDSKVFSNNFIIGEPILKRIILLLLILYSVLFFLRLTLKMSISKKQTVQKGQFSGVLTAAYFFQLTPFGYIGGYIFLYQALKDVMV